MSRRPPPRPAGEGAPEPLGASLVGGGINLVVWAPLADAVEVCLFDASGQDETHRFALPARTGPVWHGAFEGVSEGDRYGLRVHGPFDPAAGARFNPHRLLLDPWALAIDRPFTLDPSMFDAAGFNPADSAAAMPKAIVADLSDLADRPAPPPRVPWGEMVIYELHVRGFTRTHPDIPEPLRGTFAGLAHPKSIRHLTDLGVTTVELMPAAAWVDERHLPPLGLSNYWGYNPVAFLCPDPRLAPGGWREVRAAVEALHAAGIDTLLDLVLNHTGEGDHLGPTLSMRGLDNAGFYRLHPDDPARYVDDAGTGNVLALDSTPGLRLAMDALRAWRRLGGVQGFRFDLATVMGRRADGFDPCAPLLAAIAQDPDLRGLRLIAEPWDLGPGGYRLGGFPHPFAEWNDRWRDTVRGFWRGDGVTRGDLARRLAGSQDIFAARRPSASVNYVAAHDGFTLADLVSYEVKHNDANGEASRDGTDHNLSWSHGVEGPTDEPVIAASRLADQRALLATLLVSRGTPMIAMGAETGRTQHGNNNAYAQDNATAWFDWASADHALAAFGARLIRLRAEHPALRADRFLTGAPSAGSALPDVEWLGADGQRLDPAEWDDPAGASLVAVFAEPDPAAPAGLDRVLVAMHRGDAETRVALPDARDGFAWRILTDTADPARSGETGDGLLPVAARSVIVLAETATPGRPSRASDEATLQRLADAAGLLAEWTGADGARRPVSRQTKLALLAAMDLPAATTHQVRDSLAALAEAHDRRALPFVTVARAGEPALLPLAAPGNGPTPRTWISLSGEGGQTLRLRADAASAPPLRGEARDGRPLHGLSVALPPLPAGVWEARREDQPDVACRLLVTPERAHLPDVLAAGGRCWGLSAQLYGVRRGREGEPGDQGVGDFTTLAELAEAAAAQGAAILTVNPLHALFPHARERASPYYPSDRRFLDLVHLDMAQVPGAVFDAALARRLEQEPFIDWPSVARLKAQALETATPRLIADPDLDAFIARQGADLADFALFEAISETRPGEPWRTWPAGLREPRSAESRAFAAAHASRIRFHQAIQLQCERQFAAAAMRARALPIGLGRDLAVGAAPDGAELWANGMLVAGGVAIGAPPDPFAQAGQIWGLPPYDPHRLRCDGHRLFESLLTTNLRHAGALRIDHVMGLARQFWVPQGAEAADGAYVAFPFEELLALTVVCSAREQVLIIGEDLGTVPEGLRQRLSEAGVLGYRVLPFEREGPGFTIPADWPRQTLACVATHDLPPLAGWWAGDDIEERLSLGLLTPDEADLERRARAADRAALLEALAKEGLGLASTPPSPDTPLDPRLTAAIHAFVAASPAMLAVAQVEDLAGERLGVNLPGTDQERPNWRRRLPLDIAALFERGTARAVLEALRNARPA